MTVFARYLCRFWPLWRMRRRATDHTGKTPDKTFFMVVAASFCPVFYVALSKMTKYLDQIGIRIDRKYRRIYRSRSDLIEPIKPIRWSAEWDGIRKRQNWGGEKRRMTWWSSGPHLRPRQTLAEALGHAEKPSDSKSQEENGKCATGHYFGEIAASGMINEFFDITRGISRISSVRGDQRWCWVLVTNVFYGVLQESNVLPGDVEEEERGNYRDPGMFWPSLDNILRNAIAYCRECIPDRTRWRGRTWRLSCEPG